MDTTKPDGTGLGLPMVRQMMKRWGGSIRIENTGEGVLFCPLRHQTPLKRVVGDKDVKYPVCVDGARRAPPEDVGGTGCYVEFLEAWRDPSHEEHKAMRRWAGRTSDPERFDAEATTKAIAKALRCCRGGYRFRLEG